MVPSYGDRSFWETRPLMPWTVGPRVYRRQSGSNPRSPIRSMVRLSTLFIPPDFRKLTRKSLRGFQLADPDVAKAHGIAVVLQSERQFVGMRFVGRTLAVRCRPGRFNIVLREHAVVQHRYASGAEQFPVFVETGAVKNDVIGLPLAGRARSVDERWILAVDGRRLAIGVGFVFVGIEHLNFVQSHQENAS